MQGILSEFWPYIITIVLTGGAMLTSQVRLFRHEKATEFFSNSAMGVLPFLPFFSENYTLMLIVNVLLFIVTVKVMDIGQRGGSQVAWVALMCFIPLVIISWIIKRSFF